MVFWVNNVLGTRKLLSKLERFQNKSGYRLELYNVYYLQITFICYLVHILNLYQDPH